MQMNYVIYVFFDAIDTSDFDIYDTKHDTNLIQMTLIYVIQNTIQI